MALAAALQAGRAAASAPLAAPSGLHVFDCAAPVDVKHVRSLQGRSGGDFEALRGAAQRYLFSKLDPPLASGCELVSLTHTTLRVLAPARTPNTPAQDVWPPGGPIRARAQPNAVSHAGGSHQDVDSARQQRHRLWTQGEILAAEPGPPAQQSVAIVQATDSRDSLLSYLSVRHSIMFAM